MSFSHDVRRDFFAVRQANTSDLTKSGVWLLRRHGRYLKANAALDRSTVTKLNALHRKGIPGVLEVWSFGVSALRDTAVTDELIDSRHGGFDGRGLEAWSKGVEGK